MKIFTVLVGAALVSGACAAVVAVPAGQDSPTAILRETAHIPVVIRGIDKDGVTFVTTTIEQLSLTTAALLSGPSDLAKRKDDSTCHGKCCYCGKQFGCIFRCIDSLMSIYSYTKTHTYPPLPDPMGTATMATVTPTIGTSVMTAPTWNPTESLIIDTSAPPGERAKRTATYENEPTAPAPTASASLPTDSAQPLVEKRIVPVENYSDLLSRLSRLSVIRSWASAHNELLEVTPGPRTGTGTGVTTASLISDLSGLVTDTSKPPEEKVKRTVTHEYDVVTVQRTSTAPAVGTTTVVATGYPPSTPATSTCLSTISTTKKHHHHGTKTGKHRDEANETGGAVPALAYTDVTSGVAIIQTTVVSYVTASQSSPASGSPIPPALSGGHHGVGPVIVPSDAPTTIIDPHNPSVAIVLSGTNTKWLNHLPTVATSYTTLGVNGSAESTSESSGLRKTHTHEASVSTSTKRIEASTTSNISDQPTQFTAATKKALGSDSSKAVDFGGLHIVAPMLAGMALCFGIALFL